MSKVGMRYQQWAFMRLDSETLKRIWLGEVQWMPRAIISHELGGLCIFIATIYYYTYTT